MTEIFLPQVDFCEVVYEVVHQGWSFRQQALSLGICKDIRLSLPALEWHDFLDQGKVYQEFRVAHLCDTGTYPEPIKEVNQHLGAIVRQHSGRYLVLRDWQPSEVAIQSYATPTAGIGRHRDYSADAALIVVITVDGSGKILVYPDRDSQESSHCLETVSGSMMVLAGTGLLEDDALRTVHEVPPAICQPRVSAAFRMPVGAKPG